jgi:hypothetical protein
MSTGQGHGQALSGRGHRHNGGAPDTRRKQPGHTTGQNTGHTGQLKAPDTTPLPKGGGVCQTKEKRSHSRGGPIFPRCAVSGRQ